MIMTHARFMVKDGQFVETCDIPGNIKIGWINSAIITNGYQLDTKVMDVCPIIFAEPFDLSIIQMAYNTPNKKFEVFVETPDDQKPGEVCDKND